MSERRSIIFCGTPAFAVPSLKALLADKTFDVQLVITQPDRPQGRKMEMTPSPVKMAALEANIPVFQPENINKELENYLKEHDIAAPDFLIVVAYGSILSQATLDLPKVSPINIHGSLLPRWRGASPIEHAVLMGDKQTGVTIQRMVWELDAGPILAMEALDIGLRDTALELREKLAIIGADLLVNTLHSSLKEEEQPSDGITIAPRLTREDAKTDLATMTAEEIDRRVRALNPWPSVMVQIKGEEVKVLDASLEPSTASIPLECAKGTTLHLLTIQSAGKKPMGAAEWARGRK